MLGRAAARGVDVRGLVWHSASAAVAGAEGDNAEFGARLRALGVEAWLDMRVRNRGSHHQKLVVLRHRDASHARRRAYVGGIDLCHSRRDDATHGGDPQADGMADGVWRDPAVARRTGRDLGAGTCTMWRRSSGSAGRIRLRWTAVLGWWRTRPAAAAPAVRAECRARCRRSCAPPPPRRRWYARGAAAEDLPPAAVQQGLRLRQGRERSVARGYTKAIERARRLVYVEDQYLWGRHVAQMFSTVLDRHPDLFIIGVVPLYPNLEGAGSAAAAGGPTRAMRDLLRRAPRPSRDLRPGEPCRHPGLRARQGLRHRRHLDHDRLRQLQPALLDPRLRTLRGRASAARLDAWWDGGQTGPRPAGRLRRIEPTELGLLTRAVASVPYALLHDPDGRPRRLRRTDDF